MWRMKTPAPRRLALSIALATGSIALAAEPTIRPKDAAEEIGRAHV
jgi:hypothetical protein